MSKVPFVAIVGRMNVGKSTLFNRLSKSVKSLTMDYAGVTRDVIKDTVSWRGRDFALVDTGGISFKKSKDPLLEQVRQKAIEQLSLADVVLFVVDGSVGVFPEDAEIARELRKRAARVVLVINKEDIKGSEEFYPEFERLYHKNLVKVSAQHSRGINDLLDAVLELLPADKACEDVSAPEYRVVFIGRPNVGKSSLTNLLLKEERQLVSDQPGTTREAVSERITFYRESLVITDTPGIRRPRVVDDELETLMVKSSLRALKESDIVVLLTDASEIRLVDQELKLAFYAFQELNKALVILINKADLLDEAGRAELEASFAPYDHLMKKVELMFISCKTGKNVGRVLPLIKEVWERHHQQLPVDELKILLVDASQRVPIVKCEKRLLVRNVHQIGTAPITIKLKVNYPIWFGTSQLAFFENTMRKRYDLVGVPIKFIVH